MTFFKKKKKKKTSNPPSFLKKKQKTVFDTPADVPADVAENKRYAAAAGKGFTVSECAANLEKAIGGAKIDVLVHSLANGPEVAKPLLETSRNGYLAAVSASSYSYVSMLQRFGPLMNKGMRVFLSFFFLPFFSGFSLSLLDFFFFMGEKDFTHPVFVLSSFLSTIKIKKQAAPRSRSPTSRRRGSSPDTVSFCLTFLVLFFFF